MQACCCRRDAHIRYARHEEHAACKLTSRHALAGGGRSELESRASIQPRTRGYQSEYAMPNRFGDSVLRQQTYTNAYATSAGLRFDGRDLRAPCASLPPCRGTSRGRMPRVGATCTASRHGRPKRITAPEDCKIGAVDTTAGGCILLVASAQRPQHCLCASLRAESPVSPCMFEAWLVFHSEIGP